MASHHHPSASSAVAFRERMNHFYFYFFNRHTNNMIILLSVFLLLLSLIHRESVGHAWYHWLEGIVTILFASEVGLRLWLMRAGFWESSVNVVEAVMAVFCILVFSLLSFAHHTSRVEHSVLIFLRYSAQLLRLAGLLHQGGSSLVPNGSGGGSPHCGIGELKVVGGHVVQPHSRDDDIC